MIEWILIKRMAVSGHWYITRLWANTFKEACEQCLKHNIAVGAGGLKIVEEGKIIVFF